MFVYAISSLEVNVICLVAFGCYVSDGLVDRDKKFMDKLEQIYGVNEALPFLVCTIFSTITALIALIANSNLILLHIWLKSKGMTTFDYIMQLRRRHREKIAKQSEDYQPDISSAKLEADLNESS